MHSDIKSNNIFLTIPLHLLFDQYPFVKIGDFGPLGVSGSVSGRLGGVSGKLLDTPPGWRVW